MDESKPFWFSKTFWTNIVVGLLGMFSTDTVAENPEAAVGFIAFINVILRGFTKNGVTLS